MIGCRQAPPHNHIREAMLDEMRYLCAEVFECVDLQEAHADPHKVIVGSVVTCNTEDSDNPKSRGRYAAQDVNTGGTPTPSFYAATPPLEAKRLLMSRGPLSDSAMGSLSSCISVTLKHCIS